MKTNLEKAMSKELYISAKVRKHLCVSIFGQEKTLSCDGLGDGCIGVALVYSNQKDALKDAEDYILVEITQ